MCNASLPLAALLKLLNLTVDLNSVQAEERFMVDMATYQLMHPISIPPGPVMQQPFEDPVTLKLDPWPRKVDKIEELSDKTAMLLPSTMFGFRLQAKKWSEHAHPLFRPTIRNDTAAFMRLVN